MFNKKDLQGIVILLVVACIAAMVRNKMSDSGIAWVGQWNTTKGVVTALAKNGVVKPDREINDFESLKNFLSEDGVVLADVRHESAFIEGHIPGALPLPLARFDEVIGPFIEMHPPETLILLYCSGKECHESHTFADELVNFGYFNVKIFAGGFTEWKMRGLPVEKEHGYAG